MKRILLLLMSVFIAAAVFSQDRVRAYLVSNAHFDSQWNWDVQRSIREYIPKTLDQNLFLLGTYPDYVFNFEGGIKYQWMKEYYPHQYELIKRYIREGRWHVTAARGTRRIRTSLLRSPSRAIFCTGSTSTAGNSGSKARTSSFRTASVSGGRFRRSRPTAVLSVSRLRNSCGGTARSTVRARFRSRSACGRASTAPVSWP